MQKPVKKTTKSKPTKSKLPYVIARCRDAGVHAGELVHYGKNGFLELRNARRLWYWNGAGSLSELAVYGCNPKATGNKYGAKVTKQELRVSDVCELIHCQPDGRSWIESQPEWRA